jgi:hypothetical protein
VISLLVFELTKASGYLEIQGTKPQTITYALADSPLGQLAWIRDKMQPLVSNSFRWEDEEVITWAMMYIIPGSSGSAAIYTNAKGKKSETFQKVLLNKPLPASQDFGASLFPDDVFNVPRFWAAATISSNIVFWKEHTDGGHFASVEKPVELVEDIRDFTKSISSVNMAALKQSGKLKL